MDRRRAARIAAETLDAIDKGGYGDAVGRAIAGTVGYPLAGRFAGAFPTVVFAVFDPAPGQPTLAAFRTALA